MKAEHMRLVSKILAAALTACILWAAYPPRSEAYGILFALVPMLALTRLVKPGAAARWWFVSSFAFWFATLAWMPAVCKNNGPWPLVVLGWTGLAALCSGYFALFGFLSATLWRKVAALRKDRLGAWTALAAPILEAILWAGVEWLRGVLFTGFAWNFLGTALGDYPSFAVPARLGGVYLLSALVVLANGVFTTMALRALRPMLPPEEGPAEAPALSAAQQRALRFLETALPLLVIWAALEAAKPTQTPQPAVTSLRVALIQRNAPCVFSQRDAEDPYQPFFGLLDKVALARPDLVVLAESAFAEFGTARSDRARQAALHFANRAGGAAVIGGADDAVYSNGVKRVYNAAAYYSPHVENALVDVYHKQHLVPFGEYIFLDKWITPLQRLSPIGVSLHPGEPKLFDLDGVKIAPLICFEDTDPALARRAAADGADVIVLITNDSWFSGSIEAVQHAHQAVMRAIETGLPILRVGNSGVTGIITPSGHTRWLTDGTGKPLVDQPGCQIESVPIVRQATRTPYVRIGDSPLLVLFALTLAGIFLPFPRRSAA